MAGGQDAFDTPLAAVPDEGGPDETAGKTLANAAAVHAAEIATTELAAADISLEASGPDTVVGGMETEQAPSLPGSVAAPAASLDAVGDEVLAPAPADQSVPAATGGLLSGATAPAVDEDSALEKRKRRFGLSPLEPGKDKKPRPGAPSTESANPAVDNEAGAINQPAVVASEEKPAGGEQDAKQQLLSAAKDTQAGPEEAVVLGDDSALDGRVFAAAEGELPPSAPDSAPVAVMEASTEESTSPPFVENTTTAVDTALTSQVGEAAVIEESLEEMAAPALDYGSGALDTTEEARLALEVSGVDEGTPTAATPVPAIADGLGEPISNKKRAHRKGFSFGRLFGWDKKDKPRSRATSVENTSAMASKDLPKPLDADDFVAVPGGAPAAVAAVPVGEEDGATAGGQGPPHLSATESTVVPPTSMCTDSVETVENPPGATVDGSAAAMTSAMTEGVSDTIKTPSDAIKTTADHLGTDHMERVPSAAAEAGRVQQPGKVGLWP